MAERRVAEEHEFESWDGTRLFYRAWMPATGRVERALVLVHRGHEHSGRLQNVVDTLDLPDFAVFAHDQRGLGRSDGERGRADSFGVLVRDLDAVVRQIAERSGLPQSEIAVIGQSVGAVVAATWVHDYAPPLRALVLASPAFSIKLYVPFALSGLRLILKLRPRAVVMSYVKARFLTHDPEVQKSYDSDPLIVRPIAANLLVDLFDTSRRVVADAAAIDVPTLLLTSGADFVVHKRPQQQFFQRLGSTLKHQVEFPGFYHDTLNERDRHLPLAEVRRFLRERFAAPPVRIDLLHADRAGVTRAEHDTLLQPAPPLRRLGFALTTLAMRSVGRLSEGIRLGLDTGFDSGSTLDYVYRNQARGTTFAGRLIDRNYLDSPGWVGIRQRRVHLERALDAAIREQLGRGEPVHVVDIAAGHGRYVIAVLARFRDQPVSALLRDFSPLNVAAGQALIEAERLGGQVRFELGDAFNAASLRALHPSPSIGIVSGLYELFPENAPVLGSLQGLAAALLPGGSLLYTGQPWHPQLELIARVLTSHRDGKPWVMRRRTQAEMDQLVAAAGLEKRGQEIDRFGIFTVSSASKPR